MGVSLRNSAYEAGTCCECGSVEALGVLHGAELAIAAVLSPNKAGELLVKGLIVKTEALQCAGTKGGQEDICRLEQMVHDLQALFVLAVDCRPLLVEGTAVIGNVVELGAESHAPSHALGALLVAGERLNLDYGCAHFSQCTTSSRASSVLGQLDNLYSLQTCHWILLWLEIRGYAPCVNIKRGAGTDGVSTPSKDSLRC